MFKINVIQKISTYLMFGLSALFLLVVLTKVGVVSFVGRGTSTALAAATQGAPGTPTAPSQVCTPGSFERQCTGQCGGCAANAGEAKVSQCRADGSGFSPIPPTGSECETQCAGPCVAPAPAPAPAPAQVMVPFQMPNITNTLNNTNTNTNTNTSTNTNTNVSESNSSSSNSNSNTNIITPPPPQTTCPAGENLVTNSSGQVVCMPPSVTTTPPPPPPPPPSTFTCPAGTTAQTQGSAIVCVSNQTAQTTPATVTIAVAQPATPQVVQTAGNVQVKELPKTGLPLAGWMLSGLLPVGFRMKKFGRSIRDRFSATDVWEERQYKSTFRD